MTEPFIQLKGISKYFSRVIANKDVSFSINKGEVLALLGENGAGKSTIMKILYGLYQAEEGEILINEKPSRISSPQDAMNQGIGMIQQHFSLIPAHSVVENIILGNEKGILNPGKLNAKITDLIHKYKFEIDPQSLIKDLPVGVQQKVEILKALYQDVELLIMDEPTAVLTPQESLQLIEFINEFKEKGAAIVFISHKLQEVMLVADRIIVMRNGEITGELNKNDTNEEELSRLMIGKDLPPIKVSPRDSAERLLEVNHLTVKGAMGHTALDDLSFYIEKGEILGIAGVSGNGQQELGETLSGLNCGSLEGKILLDGESIEGYSVRQCIEAGIGYVHADRHRAGLVLDMSLKENLLLKSSYDNKWSSKTIINRKKLEQYADEIVENYSVKTSGIDSSMKGLSGGNQQKVVLGREVMLGHKLVIFDQPTRGLDLGAIEYVHRSILEERDKGKSILLISTELSEIFALSDRIGVLYNGKIIKTMNKDDADVESIGMLMAGINTEKGNE